jgi:hypothetical protein
MSWPGAWAFALVVALTLPLGGCGAARQQSPQEALSAYARALREKRHQDAYQLLSTQAKKDIPYATFERILKENPEEAKELAESFSHPAAPPVVNAVVSTPEGDSLLLVFEDGAWRVDASAVDLYGQATPLAALRSVVRAFKNRRYDVLLRFVPDAEREGLGVPELKQAWEGDQREELERLVLAVNDALPTGRLEVTGDRATLAFGAGGTVELLRERGLWKIEDLR